MDASSFDQLARALGQERSRKGLLSGIAALLAASVGVRTSLAATCPVGQYAGSGGRCLCKTTGRPPIGGDCPCGAGKGNCIACGPDLTYCPLDGKCFNPNADGCCTDADCRGSFCSGGSCRDGFDPCTSTADCLPGLICTEGLCLDPLRPRT